MSATALLLGSSLGYLLLLFLLAYAVDEGWLPARLASHPLTYTLSLGSYATTWSFYGSVGFAAQEGYLFIGFYFGATLTMILAPLLLEPLLRVVREHQLGSVADLFAFRFPSPITGALISLCMLISLLPYIALQVQAVVTSADMLTDGVSPTLIGLLFCGTLSLFAVLFGARQLTPRIKHEGLVVAIAFESLIKLAALLLVTVLGIGLLARHSSGEHWLQLPPQAIEHLLAPLRDPANDAAWSSLLLVAFASTFLLPRQFHMMFTENMNPQALRTASWGFPLFLLAVNLAVPSVLWASASLGLPGPTDYLSLTLMQQIGPWASLICFIGGLSAASAMIIIESLALASMCQNHLLLPLWLRLRSPLAPRLDRSLLWARRALITGIICCGYLAYLWIRDRESLVSLGLMSFTAISQFLPGVIAMLTWPRANRTGFLAGLICGFAVWMLIDIWPLLSGLPSPLAALPLADSKPWVFSTFWSLGSNIVVFIIGTFVGRPGHDEADADQALRLHAVLMAPTWANASSVAALEAGMAQLLGQRTARVELLRALRELGLSRAERRPRPMYFLQDRLMRNLSGLVGPQLAQRALGAGAPRPLHDAALVEDALEKSQAHLSGLAAELDHLRRMHRQILQSLPIGVCSIDANGLIQLWNQCLCNISAVPAESALGLGVEDLPAPWNRMLTEFLATSAAHGYRLQLPTTSRRYNLHRERIAGQGGEASVLLIEDLSEQLRLEHELAHRERLAALGTLAAGVAHEIGNPLTGISCAAQALQHGAAEAERSEFVAEILQQTRRINAIVNSLLGFARADNAPAAAPATLQLSDVVDDAVRLCKLSNSARQLRFVYRIDPSLSLPGDRGQLTQVLVNLLVNAADASASDGQVRIDAQRTDAGWLCIRIADDGSGIAPELLDRVFEPFFTTKDPGRGTGLGLALVYRIVADHGGDIRIDSQPGAGTCVQLRLPMSPDCTGIRP